MLSLAPALIIAVLLAFYFISTQIANLERSLVERGQAIARQLAPASEYGVFSGNREILGGLARAAMKEADVRRIAITDAAGKLLIGVGRSAPPTPTPPPDISDISTTVLEDCLIFHAPIHSSQVAVEEYMHPPGPGAGSGEPERAPLGWVHVELSLESTLAHKKEFILRSLLIMLLGLSATAVLARHMGRKVSDPILHLTDTVKKLGEGALDVRARVGTDGEWQTLATGINTMAANLKEAQGHLQERVQQATEELRTALARLSTQNAEIEDARKAALRLSEIKSEFVANMSHEIRTPLNGVLGFIELLAETDLDAHQRDFLKTIDISARRLLSIVNDILDFSKIEAGRMSIEDIDLELREIVEEAVAPLAPAAHAKGLDLILLINHDVPLALRGDPMRIAQVITNLLSNAVKFTEAGQIVLQVERLDETENEAFLRFSVTDTGIGIAPDARARLFRAFTQVDTSTTRHYGGTGLGLTICKRLVEMMGGNLGVESTPGQGACFWFRLRLPKQAGAPPAEHLLAGSCVLTVSASEGLVHSLDQMFTAWGVTARRLASADETLQELREAAASGLRYDALLLDLALPDMAAADTVQKIAGDRLLDGSRIVLLGNTYERLEMHPVKNICMEARVIAKPPRASEVYNALCAVRSRDGGASWAGLSVPPRVEVRPGARLRVLLADDNEINRRLIGLLLRALGARVEEVTDGIQAVDASLRENYDIILMDIHMPNMDGVEAAKKIRTLLGRERRPPIIAITANVLPQDRKRYLTEGMDDHLPKPITKKSLQQIIAKWCSEPAARVPEAAPAAAVTGGEPETTVLDPRLGIELAAGSEQVWREALAVLLRELPESRDNLRRAQAARDLAAMRRLAHKLHGSCSYCGTPALQRTAKTLEAACVEENPDKAAQALGDLEREMERLVRCAATP
jgi:two-component system sensor histidine kinase BarA